MTTNKAMNVLAAAFLTALAAPGGAGAAEIDSEALLEDIRELSSDVMEGRLVGTEGSAAARRYIVSRFADAGVWGGRSDGFWHDFSFDVAAGKTPVEGVNVVGAIDGRREDASRIIVISAHYDHLGVANGEIYNGADDNASGVAAMIAIADALHDDPLEHDVLFVALDAEEIGSAFNGADAWLDDPETPFDNIALNVNIDMVSRADDGVLWAGGSSHYPFLREPLAEAAASSDVRLQLGHDGGDGLDDWSGSSDHAAFHARGVPYVFYSVLDHEDYHQPTDDFENIDPAFYADAVGTILSSIRLLDARLDEFPMRRGSAK